MHTERAKRTIKKQISPFKFSRLQRLRRAVPCTASRWSCNTYEVENSKDAFIIGDYLYARFKCRRQSNNRIKTYCTRYWIGDSGRDDSIFYCKQVKLLVQV